MKRKEIKMSYNIKKNTSVFEDDTFVLFYVCHLS